MSQRYSVHVPFGDVSLQMGDSAAGEGASLSTIGDVLIDSVGVADLQSKGDLMAQTNAAMTLLSGSSSHIHSQGKVEIFAGGGLAPGPCGGGGPAAPSDTGAPGQAAEIATNLACNGLAGLKAAQGFQSAAAAGDTVNMVKSALDGAKAVTGVAGLATPEAGKAGAVLEAVSGYIGYASAVMSGDVGGAVSGLASVITGGAGAAGGGGADIKENATGNIAMVAGKKISGTAPLGIDSKTPAKYEVKSLAVIDFKTISFTNFVLAKFEVKALDKIGTGSSVFEHAVKATAKIHCRSKFEVEASKITQDGKVRVTETVDVGGNTSFKNDLSVKKDVVMKKKLTVKKLTEVKGKIVVKRAVLIDGDTTAKAKTKTKKLVAKATVTFM